MYWCTTSEVAQLEYTHRQAAYLSFNCLKVSCTTHLPFVEAQLTGPCVQPLAVEPHVVQAIVTVTIIVVTATRSFINN